MNNNLSFVFKGYKANISSGRAEFNYEINGGKKELSFTEKIYFSSVVSSIQPILLKAIFNNLMLILGISYWKTYCPKEIIIESNFLTKNQAEFWNTVYTKGLGEFFYKNDIDFRGLIQFPSARQNSEKAISFPRKDRTFLGLGGGKDSIVAAEILKKQNKDFDLFTVGTSEIQEGVANLIGKKPILIKRELDSKLFELNKEKGVYNGHIPISIIYAFLGLLASVLYDYSSVVVGNEKSANYGNVIYLGEIINHQWSKSEEFEKLFNEYVGKYITESVSYFSLLRNMSELEVMKEFVKYPKYFKAFSSCNRNFKILRGVYPERSRRAQDDNKRWCGECAKCLFVFTLLCVFLSKKEVLGIFGQNLFENKTLLKPFKELLGLENFKPFECVGTPEEMSFALENVYKKGEFSKTPLMEFFVNSENRRECFC